VRPPEQSPREDLNSGWMGPSRSVDRDIYINGLTAASGDGALANNCSSRSNALRFGSRTATASLFATKQKSTESERNDRRRPVNSFAAGTLKEDSTARPLRIKIKKSSRCRTATPWNPPPTAMPRRQTPPSGYGFSMASTHAHPAPHRLQDAPPKTRRNPVEDRGGVISIVALAVIACNRQ